MTRSWSAGLDRAPVHGTSIAATEWYIDSHACSFERHGDSRHEGKVTLHAETFPGMVPYEALLPKELDNLLVVNCVSSTHIGWNTIRLGADLDEHRRGRRLGAGPGAARGNGAGRRKPAPPGMHPGRVGG